MKYRNKQQGFSFLEILIVVIVTSILIAIAIAALNTSKADAGLLKLRIALQKVDEAKIRYYLDTKDPNRPDLTNLVAYLQVPTGAGEEIFYTKRAWEAAHPAKDTAGLLLNGAVTKKAQIEPGSKNVPATLLEWEDGYQ